MTATALQFDFGAPARRLPVRRPASLTLIPGGDRRARTLDDVLVEGWERLRSGHATACPACGAAMAPIAGGGACVRCGSTLS